MPTGPTISSRTPEGDPNQCPFCGHHVRIEPSLGTWDAPCPSCGHLLWFVERSPYVRDNPDVRISVKVIKEVLDRAQAVERRLREMFVQFVSERLGPPSDPAKAAIDQMPTSKFARIEWDLALRARNWEEVVGLAGNAPTDHSGG
jgi:DNA-directed RNA polymerase subunit RPC12/RpoP